MGICNEVIEPSVKLSKMMRILKFYALIHVLLAIADIIFFKVSFFFLLLFSFLYIIISIKSKNFGNQILVIIFCIMMIAALIQRIGARIIGGFIKFKDDKSFYFLSFLLIFEIFCAYLMFQVYKQSKYEYKISYGYAPGEEGDQDIVIIEGDNQEGDNQIDDL